MDNRDVVPEARDHSSGDLILQLDQRIGVLRLYRLDHERALVLDPEANLIGMRHPCSAESVMDSSSSANFLSNGRLAA